MKKLFLLFTTLTLASTSQAYYQAEQGRWLNRDPIGEVGTFSWVKKQKKYYESVAELNANRVEELNYYYRGSADFIADFGADNFNRLIGVINEFYEARLERLAWGLYFDNLSEHHNRYLFVDNNTDLYYDYLGMGKGFNRKGLTDPNSGKHSPRAKKAANKGAKYKKQKRTGRGGVRCLIIFLIPRAIMMDWLRQNTPPDPNDPKNQA